MILNRSAEMAFEPFKSVPFKPFRDASYNKNCSYKCTVKMNDILIVIGLFKRIIVRNKARLV